MIEPYYKTDLGRLYHGDCLGILPQLTEKVDLVLTSPPYDNLRDYRGYIFDFKNVARKLADSLCEKGGIIVWIVSDATVDGDETGTSFRQALFFKSIGLKLYDTMIYHKTDGGVPHLGRYTNCFEYMFIFNKGIKIKTFNPICDRKNTWVGNTGKRSKRERTGELTARDPIEIKPFGWRFNLWGYSTGKNKSASNDIAYEHPAIFPEKLAQDHIRSWSNTGDLILDPFLGSGTTALACERLDRRWIGIEISKEYCDIAVRRIEQERAQLKLGLG